MVRDLETLDYETEHPALQFRFYHCGHSNTGPYWITPCCQLSSCDSCFVDARRGICTACNGAAVWMPARRFRGSYPQGPITLLIGPDNTRFDFHLGGLAAHSHLVHKILTAHYSSTTGIVGHRLAIHFPELDPTVMMYLATYLYRADAGGSGPTSAPTFPDIVKLWRVAEQLVVPKLQNALIGIAMEMATPADTVIPIEAVKDAFKLMRPGSPLRSFMTCLYTQRSPWHEAFSDAEAVALRIPQTCAIWASHLASHLPTHLLITSPDFTFNRAHFEVPEENVEREIDIGRFVRRPEKETSGDPENALVPLSGLAFVNLGVGGGDVVRYSVGLLTQLWKGEMWEGQAHGRVLVWELGVFWGEGEERDRRYGRRYDSQSPLPYQRYGNRYR